MKVTHLPALDPENGLHFEIEHDDGRTTPVQVSTIGLEQFEYAPGGVLAEATKIALAQAHANFTADSHSPNPAAVRPAKAKGA